MPKAEDGLSQAAIRTPAHLAVVAPVPRVGTNLCQGYGGGGGGGYGSSVLVGRGVLVGEGRVGSGSLVGGMGVLVGGGEVGGRSVGSDVLVGAGAV